MKNGIKKMKQKGSIYCNNWKNKAYNRDSWTSDIVRQTALLVWIKIVCFGHYVCTVLDVILNSGKTTIHTT